MLHCTVCVGVKRTVGTWHRFLHNKREEQESKPSLSTEERVTQQTPKHFHCSAVEFTVVSDITLVKKQNTWPD